MFCPRFAKSSNLKSCQSFLLYIVFFFLPPFLFFFSLTSHRTGRCSHHSSRTLLLTFPSCTLHWTVSESPSLNSKWTKSFTGTTAIISVSPQTMIRHVDEGLIMKHVIKTLLKLTNGLFLFTAGQAELKQLQVWELSWRHFLREKYMCNASSSLFFTSFSSPPLPLPPGTSSGSSSVCS